MNHMKHKLFENENFVHVYGKTILCHDIRVRLGLTCLEYVFLDFIKIMQDQSDKRIVYQDLWKITGISPEHVPDLWKSLIKKKMVRYDKELKVVVTEDVWNTCFDRDNEFQDFWENYGRIKDNEGKYSLIGPIGNRALAFRMFKKTVKNLSPEELKEKARAYTDYCFKNERLILHASTWLNPMMRRYNDELTPVKTNLKAAENSVDPNMNGMVM